MKKGGPSGSAVETSVDAEFLIALKAECLSRGVYLDPSAVPVFSDNGRLPLTLHEYATTGGLTFEVLGAYVNAPFEEWFTQSSEAVVFADAEGVQIQYRGRSLPIRPFLLPEYLGTMDSEGRAITDVAMSHADRVRLSPIAGCSFSCDFCDIAGLPYRKRTPQQLLEALEVAKQDKHLPARHVLISGGTAAPRDHDYFDSLCVEVAARGGLETDVMLPPRTDPSFTDRLVDGGIHGFAINLEIYDEAVAAKLAPQKARLGRRAFEAAIRRAIELTGGKGRVRSLLILGLEEETTFLEGVEWLARLGCDPVLSPFRPARGTPLAERPPPTPAEIIRSYRRAYDIARAYGVKLGPRCEPCQHNTLTFPDRIAEAAA